MSNTITREQFHQVLWHLTQFADDRQPIYDAVGLVLGAEAEAQYRGFAGDEEGEES